MPILHLAKQTPLGRCSIASPWRLGVLTILEPLATIVGHRRRHFHHHRRMPLESRERSWCRLVACSLYHAHSKAAPWEQAYFPCQPLLSWLVASQKL
jgi:hypothetical protein